MIGLISVWALFWTTLAKKLIWAKFSYFQMPKYWKIIGPSGHTDSVQAQLFTYILLYLGEITDCAMYRKSLLWARPTYGDLPKYLLLLSSYKNILKVTISCWSDVIVETWRSKFESRPIVQFRQTLVSKEWKYILSTIKHQEMAN